MSSLQESPITLAEKKRRQWKEAMETTANLQYEKNREARGNRSMVRRMANGATLPAAN
jgi:hypothetical protein